MKSTSESGRAMTVIWLYMINHGTYYVFHNVSTISTLFRTKKRTHLSPLALNLVRDGIWKSTSQIKWNYDWEMVLHGQTWWITCTSSHLQHFYPFWDEKIGSFDLWQPVFSLKLRWDGIWSPHHKSSEIMTTIWFYLVKHDEWHVFLQVCTQRLQKLYTKRNRTLDIITKKKT